ncbi:MAG: TerC family protein [Gammaproteobacteria bacterium]|nr:TerC family protein [Gammaproteobacteria bacterium]NIO61714.1 TerC family protein [Gammaproteobacteria bacterium]NIQ18965.1 TerC family protein [Gammaproteobacteria bacterium]NIT05014.1 TerC family protein [Gammaproteobacteria bacterium]NIT40387.1 TerC family protein [Gammaproteobacteria bacterium]
MMEWLFEPQSWVALVTLTALEIVLGIDNIIFISILVSRLPERMRQRARFLGLSFAMLTRILLLLCLAWVLQLTSPLFSILQEEISGRDILLITGGLFLLAKSTLEIHKEFESAASPEKPAYTNSFWAVIAQIGIIDIVFSLDSVITAVGMAEHIEIMIIAVVLAILVMMFTARAISEFVENNPTIKTLALSFLILIGVALIGEGLDMHIPKGYIYFAMAFSLVVELLNMRIRQRRTV